MYQAARERLKLESFGACTNKNQPYARRHVLDTQGPTWTTDAFFRETIGEIQHYETVERAALFAISTLRGVDMASGFVISDLVATWYGILAQETHERLFRLYQRVMKGNSN